MTKLAKLIKKRRHDLGISQAVIARNLGLTNGQFISNIESDLGIQYPAVYFKQISELLNIKLKLLFDTALDDYREKLKQEIGRGKNGTHYKSKRARQI